MDMLSIRKEIVLYGAGERGRNWAEMLCAHNIEIAGFCDSYKTGSVSINNAGGGEAYLEIN